MSKKECPYKVHYKGWNKRLDEFLPEGRIIKEGGDYKIDITASPIICSEGSSDSAKVRTWMITYLSHNSYSISKEFSTYV